MTVETLTRLQIPIAPVDDTACMYAECALGWINNNTSLKYDLNNLPESLPSNVRLFILKYFELMNNNPGVTSESIQGLSQSFAGPERTGLLLWEYASELLGEYMTGAMAAVPAEAPWE